MAKVIGLTGSFGTGKTLVASIFGSLGAKVLDADEMARATVAKGSPAYKKIVEVFGADILRRNGDIDRDRLSSMVFSDRQALKRLNRIVHPPVIAAIKQSVKSARPGDVVVIDAPLLIEARLAGIADVLVVVASSRKHQIERCKRKFKMKGSDVLKRISSQIPIKEKIMMADFVVDNDGSRSETGKQVRKVWEEIVWR